MKKLIIIGSVFVLMVIIALFLGVSNLGPIIKSAVNNYGHKITKTDVSLDDVGISILKGEASLKNFHLGNPEGFKSPHAVEVASIYVDIDEGSLTKDTIVIDKIKVVAPDIIYEKKLKTDNFKALLANIQKGTSSSGDTTQQESGEETPGKKLIIKDFLIQDGSVRLASAFLGGKDVKTTLPDIHLTNLGEKAGGSSPAEVFMEILAKFNETLTSAGVVDALEKNLQNIGDELKKVGADSKAQLDNMKENAETTGDEVKKELQESRDQMKSDLDSIKEKAKGLFGN